MQVSANPVKVDTAHLAPESLAGNPHLTAPQKIAEASKQFEAILLRQILSETQKPVIQSEFTDNSTAAGIYQDFITNQLADNLAHSGAIGLAKTFERQLSPPAPHTHASPKVPHP
jgi:Rod binding domain-containing protein